MFEALLAAALTQVAPAQTPPPSDDVVVTGLRDIEAPDTAVSQRTLGSMRTGSAAASRSSFALAQTYAECVARQRTPETTALLRRAVDGVINGARQQWAQGRLQELRRTCVGAGGSNGYYERGALFVDALRRHVPDLRLTKRETADAAVQARFNAREIPLARFRLYQDRQYFEAAVCFVRVQPELSVALVRSGSLDAQRRLEAAIVNRARVCVGNARQVYFDGVQFRFYIADAVYRWTVATRGVDTLIPA